MISRSDFVATLLADVPQSADLVQEHLADYDGELLLHILMYDLLKRTVSLYTDGKEDEARQLLEFVDRCLRDGDEHVENAVAVSFVEDYGYRPDEPDALLRLWPPGLRNELKRQEEAWFTHAVQTIMASGPASSGDNLLGMEIDFFYHFNKEDLAALWADVQVHRHEGEEWLVRASANSSKANAEAIAAALARVWGDLRYPYKEVHTVTSDPDTVTLRAITQIGPSDLWVTAEVQVLLT